MSDEPMILTPNMIVGAMERHIVELVNALRSNDPMVLDIDKIRGHLVQLDPFLANLQKIQADARAALQPPQPPAANGNGAEVAN